MKSDEQKWLESVQNKLKKYISSPYWDDIYISNTYLDIIMQIMNTTNVNKLPLLINERLTEDILKDIQTKITKVKKNSKFMNHSK